MYTLLFARLYARRKKYRDKYLLNYLVETFGKEQELHLKQNDAEFHEIQ